MRAWLRHYLPYVSLAIFALAAWCWELNLDPAHEERDVSQERWEQASPPLTTTSSLGQTFVSRHPGLRAVEFLLVVYDASQPLPPGGQILLTLERLVVVAPPVHCSVSTQGLKHNQRVRLAFEPLHDSDGATYRLTLRTDGDYGLGFWETATEACAEGQMLIDDAPQPGDLLFSTFYDYHLTNGLADLWGALPAVLGLLLPLVLVLILPGAVLGAWLLPNRARSDLLVGGDQDGRKGRHQDPWILLACVLALSMAFWPLLLLWAGVLNIRLSDGRVAWVLAALAAAEAVRLWSALRERRISDKDRGGSAPSASLRSVLLRATTSVRLSDVALALVLLLTVCTRLLQVRDLAVPPWVDSVHHTLIARIIAELGMAPSSYRPYMPIDDFHYHFGFHATAAAFSWVSGLPAHRAVLALGQVYNVVAALSAYAFATVLTRRRWAGVGAALVAGTLSPFPAYFLSWGRYTQLAGLVLLPVACLATLRAWELSELPAPQACTSSGPAPYPRPSLRALLHLSGRRALFSPLSGAAFLVAGLALTHYRILVFYALFLVCYLPLGAWRSLRAKVGGQVAWSALARATLPLIFMCLVFILPWAWRFLARVLPSVEATYGGWGAVEDYNAFPSNLLDVGWSRRLLYVAAAGALWGLLRRRAELVALSAWVGTWFLAANLHLVGLRDMWLIHNSSVVISLWLPVSVLCGWMMADWGGLLLETLEKRTASPQWRRWASCTALGIVLTLGYRGSWRLVDTVNPVTVLATADDMRALEWVANNTPLTARFLVNGRGWQGALRAGTDGGYWLTNLTGRASSMPCVLYYQGSPEYRDAVNELLQSVEQVPALDDPAMRALLLERGISYIFVGTNGGKLVPKDLDGKACYRLVYAYGATRVYEFLANP